MLFRQFIILSAVLVLAGCFGGSPKMQRRYELFDPVRHATHTGGPIINVPMDSCESARAVFINENGRMLGEIFDTVICEGQHTFAVYSVYSVTDTVEPPETVWIPLDTLSRGAYFVKIFTPTSTRIIESIKWE